MSIDSIVQVSQDYLLQTGEVITLEASVPEMVETLSRMCPVFGQTMLVYNDTPALYYALPPSLLQLLSLHFFPRELEPAGVRWAQDTLDPAWRTRVGLPRRYTQELETPLQVRLIPAPAPTMTGPQGIPPFVGIPGAMVPTNHLVAFFLEAPQVVDLSPWWEDMVAYLLVAWESVREGLRNDLPMAQAMQTLVGMLVMMFRELAHDPGEELVKGAWTIPYWLNLPQT
jgi:hypothetical protein